MYCLSTYNNSKVTSNYNPSESYMTQQSCQPYCPPLKVVFNTEIAQKMSIVNPQSTRNGLNNS